MEKTKRTSRESRRQQLHASSSSDKMPSSFLSKDSSGLHACCILFVATAIVCATVATARAEAASQQFGAAGEASGPLLRLRRQAAATHQQQVEQDELMKRQLPVSVLDVAKRPLLFARMQRQNINSLRHYARPPIIAAHHTNSSLPN